MLQVADHIITGIQSQSDSGFNKIQDCLLLRTTGCLPAVLCNRCPGVLASLLPRLLPSLVWSPGLSTVHQGLAFHQQEGRKAAGSWTGALPPALRARARLRSPTLLAKTELQGRLGNLIGSGGSVRTESFCYQRRRSAARSLCQITETA